MAHDACPHCGHAEFFAIDTVESPNYEYSNALEPLGLTGFHGPTGETGFLGATRSKRFFVRMTAYVCRGCGHVSLFAKDTALLERMAREGSKVEIVRGLPGRTS